MLYPKYLWEDPGWTATVGDLHLSHLGSLRSRLCFQLFPDRRCGGRDHCYLVPYMPTISYLQQVTCVCACLCVLVQIVKNPTLASDLVSPGRGSCWCHCFALGSLTNSYFLFLWFWVFSFLESKELFRAIDIYIMPSSPRFHLVFLGRTFIGIEVENVFIAWGGPNSEALFFSLRSWWYSRPLSDFIIASNASFSKTSAAEPFRDQNFTLQMHWTGFRTFGQSLLCHLRPLRI